jgi:hypothetical protein
MNKKILLLLILPLNVFSGILNDIFAAAINANQKNIANSVYAADPLVYSGGAKLLFNKKFNAEPSAPSGGADCFDWAQFKPVPKTPQEKLMMLIDGVNQDAVNDANKLDSSVLGKALKPLKGDKAVKSFAKAVNHYVK